MTRKIHSRVVGSSPFIERRRSRRGSADVGNPHRRASDANAYDRTARNTPDAAAYSAFSSAARPHAERSGLGRQIDLYA